MNQLTLMAACQAITSGRVGRPRRMLCYGTLKTGRRKHHGKPPYGT